jgi:hypothetical protein
MMIAALKPIRAVITSLRVHMAATVAITIGVQIAACTNGSPTEPSRSELGRPAIRRKSQLTASESPVPLARSDTVTNLCKQNQGPTVPWW